MNGFAVFQISQAAVKALYSRGEMKFNSLVLQMVLDNPGSLLVQNTGQNSGSKVNHRDALHPFQYAFGAFQAYESRAHNQHTFFFTESAAQFPGIVKTHEGELLGNGIKSFERRYKRVGACRDKQPVITYLFAAVQHNLFFVCQNLLDGPSA